MQKPSVSCRDIGPLFVKDAEGDSRWRSSDVENVAGDKGLPLVAVKVRRGTIFQKAKKEVSSHAQRSGQCGVWVCRLVPVMQLPAGGVVLVVVVCGSGAVHVSSDDCLSTKRCSSDPVMLFWTAIMYGEI